MYKLVQLAILVFISIGCTQHGILVVDADQLKKLQSAGVTVVDIRTDVEYQQGHIPGVVHVNYNADNFIDQMNEMDKDQPIVIHCARGGRSSSAAKLLAKEGFSIIYDYSGGFLDWKKRGEKIEK